MGGTTAEGGASDSDVGRTGIAIRSAAGRMPDSLGESSGAGAIRRLTAGGLRRGVWASRMGVAIEPSARSGINRPAVSPQSAFVAAGPQAAATPSARRRSLHRRRHRAPPSLERLRARAANSADPCARRHWRSFVPRARASQLPTMPSQRHHSTDSRAAIGRQSRRAAIERVTFDMVILTLASVSACTAPASAAGPS